MWKFMVLFKFILVNCAVNMERSQFEYITDHLSAHECRRLVAAIQYRSHQLNKKALDSAENAIPDEIKCVDLLLEWNSTEKKGRSQTHQLVCLRLRQLGHPELAIWLSNNVYKKLEQQIAHPESISEERTSEKNEIIEIISEESWSIFISIEHIILMTIFILTLQNLLYPCLKIVCFFGISRLKKKRSDDDTKKQIEETIPLVNVSEDTTSECESMDMQNSETKV